MDKLAKLIEKRGTARTSVTKLVKRVQALDDQSETIDSISEMLEIIKSKEEVLKKLDLDIEELVTDPVKFKAEIEASEEYEDKLLAAKIKLKQKLKALDRQNSQSSNLSHNISTVREQTFTALNLPKLEIPRFAGNSNFIEFLNCFDNAIGSNDSLSKIEKFQYLKSLLSPPAYNVVAGFELNEKNYDSCLDLLKQRYGRTDYIINSYMTKLLNLEAVRNSFNVKGLRKLHDEIEVNIRNLRSLNVTEGSYGHLLNPILLKLLPQDLVLEFHRKRNKDAKCEVTEIMTFLRNEVESREICESVMNPPKSYETNRNSFQNYRDGQNYPKIKNVSTASALHTQVRNTSYCVFCDSVNSHDSVNCKNFNVECKISKLLSTGRCWLCFKRKHVSKFCRSGITCKICSSKFHHESVCRKNYKPESSMNKINDKKYESGKNLDTLQNVVEKINVENISVSHKNVNCKNKAFLQTCTIFASNDKNSVLTNAILDNASHKNFVTARLVRELKLTPIRYETLAIQSFGQKTISRKNYPVVSLNLINRNDKEQNYHLEAVVTDYICDMTLNYPDCVALNELKSKGYQLADDFKNIPTEILIGSDAFWNIVYSERIKLNDNLSLINSRFGYLIAGIGSINSISSLNQESVFLTMDSNCILFDLQKFWQIEEFADETKNLSERDKQLIKKFENSLQFNGERYVCKLMWKENSGPFKLDSNYEVAKRRFYTLKNKLNKNPEISDEYKQIVSDQLKCNVVGKCINEDINSGYYMPHTAVIRNDKATTRVRIVYDCSSKANENKNSLNDLLESGVNLYPNLLDVILKFRENQVAFCGDIEKAFLMIEIAEEDRKYLKFLWFSDETDNLTQTLQLNRLAFGLTTSPFVLACVLKFHIKKFKEEYPKCYEMLNSLYVDDLYYTAETAQDAYQLTSSAIKILRAAGFNLRKLKTNCTKLNELWRENGYEENTDFGKGAGFLGLIWDPIEDKIKLDLKDVKFSLESEITKRHVLRNISKIFDPCGFISPFVIRAKIIMQELWERGLKWDEKLPNDLEKKWKTWCLELSDLDNLIIERKLFSTREVSDVSLHVFCDASPKSYGAVSYMRYVTKQGEIKVSFIISKSKVAPLKTLTLARLELMAALIGARLGKYLEKIFPTFTQHKFFWSDSNIVLHWVKGSSKMWKPFVSNRVAQIQLLSLPECWNHCSGKENPADLTTRGESAKKVLTSSLWRYGPDWLCKPVHLWPALSVSKSTEDHHYGSDIDKELRTVTVNTVVTTSPVNSISECIDITRFSNLEKLLRVTSWVKRFTENAKSSSTKLSGPISAAELTNSLDSWIKAVQFENFEKEINQLLSKKSVTKDSRIYNFNCLLDANNFLCLQGRLQFSSNDTRTKHPLLLPNNCKFVELLIIDAHVKMGHLGVDSTLTHLREQYWILKGRQFVKKVLKNCIICRRYSAKTGTQVVAPLPPDRIHEQPAFNVSGVDFAGPFFVKDFNKCYLLIFSCAVTRAVHLELLMSLSADSFMLGFRRFISRRGLCSVLYSDNAKAFKKANSELQNWWKQISDPEVKKLFTSKGIEWKFIVERSPWWGGFWERQIRTVKMCLKKIIGKSSLSLKELETVFLEIEAMINCRPITYLYNEPSEPSPLTPSHFLVGKRLMSLPVTKPKNEELNLNRDSMVKRYKYQQTILNHFWNRWRKEYLLNLRSAYISPPSGKVTSFKVNDVVLINDERYPRNMWMMGRILELYPGRDGNVRSLLIKTPKGEIKRSVQLVSNLELNS